MKDATVYLVIEIYDCYGSHENLLAVFHDLEAAKAYAIAWAADEDNLSFCSEHSFEDVLVTPWVVS